MKKSSWVLLLLALHSPFYGEVDFDEEALGMGLIPFEVEEVEQIDREGEKVKKVFPNKLGASRMQHEALRKGRECCMQDASIAYQPEQEWEITLNADEIEESLVVADLPRKVDNSQLPSFPPIGNQGSQGSCVGWASTYYQASHEINLLNGNNAKLDESYRLSPSWTYNMINRGVDGGSRISDAYELLSQNGALNIVRSPYDPSDFRKWKFYQWAWIEAMSNRTAEKTYIPVLKTVNGNRELNLEAIKTILANGHVLTFGSYSRGWRYQTIQENPETENECVGERAIAYVAQAPGGHMVTIVGYNDDIWVDINGDGKVDEGEKGAFLIANSWGERWGNKGFMWISYDAFRPESIVPGVSQDDRANAAATSGGYFMGLRPKAYNYKPELIALFTVRQNERNQISVSAGASLQDADFPPSSQFLRSGALNFQGGAYRFSGADPESTTWPREGTFALDLTDLKQFKDADRFYLKILDNMLDNPSALLDFRLKDMLSDTVYEYPGTLPLTFDNERICPYIDYKTPVAERTSQGLSASISSVEEGQILHGFALLAAKVNTDEAVVEFYVDSNCVSVDREAPYACLLDTSKLSNGAHTVSIVAFGPSGEHVFKSAQILVQN